MPSVGWLKSKVGMPCLHLLQNSTQAITSIQLSEPVVGWDLATFDVRWRESLAERYRWASLFSNSYFLWGSLGGLARLGYLVRRNRRQRHLNKLAQQEDTVDTFFRT